MKKIKLVLITFAAIIGVGGAYAVEVNPARKAGTIFNWYTYGGTFQVTGTYEQVKSICSGGIDFCLRGTFAIPGGGMVIVTLYNRR